MIKQDYEIKMLDSSAYSIKEQESHKYTKVVYTSPKGNTYTVKTENSEKFENIHKVNDSWSKKWS
jgi:hypothetical protein